MSRPVHFDVAAKEPQKFADFYTKVFGWKFQGWGGPMEYLLIETGPEGTPGINGGLSKGEPSDKVVLTLSTRDLDAGLKLVEQNGGKVIQPRSAIPGVGWYAAFKDPTGNAFGLMQDDPSAK